MSETPEGMDLEERRRVRALLKAAESRPRLRESHAQIRRRDRNKQLSISPARGQLGYSSSLALGDAVMKKLKDREYIKAQHGPVRILVKNGKPVNEQ